MINNYAEAINLQEKGFSIYPLSPGSKIPLKGSSGWNDATKDIKQIKEWWEEDNTRNVGLMLKDHNMVVIDLDRHDEQKNGVENCKKLWDRYGAFPPTYTELTPSNGVHFFFKIPDGIIINQETGAFKEIFGIDEKGTGKSGIDIITFGVPIYPTILANGSQYKPLNNGSLENVAIAPDWLIKLLLKQQPTKKVDYRPVTKTKTAITLDSIFNGASEGGRDTHLTSICGWLLWHGVDNETLAELLHTANQYNSPPLQDKDVNKIIKSMIKKDLRGKQHGS